MYKWLFFAMLGVNAVLMGVNFNKFEIKSTEIIKEVSRNKGGKEVGNKFFKSEFRTKKNVSKKSPKVSDRDLRVQEVKDKLFLNQRAQLEAQYSYFFTYHDLSHHEFERVVELLHEKDLQSWGCFGDGIDNTEDMLTSLTKITSAEVAEHVTDMLNKQWAFESLERILSYELENVQDITVLVDEMQSRQDEMVSSELLGYAPLEDDPFAEADPFAEEDTLDEDDPFVELDEALVDDNSEDLEDDILDELGESVEDELRRQEEQKQIIKYIDQAYNEMADKEKLFLEAYLKALSNHIEITDKIHLRLINELLN